MFVLIQLANKINNKVSAGSCNSIGPPAANSTRASEANLNCSIRDMNLTFAVD